MISGMIISAQRFNRELLLWSSSWIWWSLSSEEGTREVKELFQLEKGGAESWLDKKLGWQYIYDRKNQWMWMKRAAEGTADGLVPWRCRLLHFWLDGDSWSWQSNQIKCLKTERAFSHFEKSHFASSIFWGNLDTSARVSFLGNIYNIQQTRCKCSCSIMHIYR